MRKSYVQQEHCATKILENESNIGVREDTLCNHVFGSSDENRQRTVTNIVNLIFYNMVEKSHKQQRKQTLAPRTHMLNKVQAALDIPLDTCIPIFHSPHWYRVVHPVRETETHCHP